MTEKEYRSHPAISRSELWKIRESPEKFKYLKENPELIPVYSDININQCILLTKRKMYESECECYVETRPVTDEFIEAYDVPF